MDDFLQALTAGESLREMAGNRPLPLDDPECAWLVCAGSVDVFAVASLPDQAAGARAHLFRAGEGRLLFGVGPGDGPNLPNLLAVGLPGSQVAPVSLARLQALGSDPAFAGRVGALLDGWIEGLTAGLARRPAPQNGAPLHPDQEASL